MCLTQEDFSHCFLGLLWKQKSELWDKWLKPLSICFYSLKCFRDQWLRAAALPSPLIHVLQPPGSLWHEQQSIALNPASHFGSCPILGFCKPLQLTVTLGIDNGVSLGEWILGTLCGLRKCHSAVPCACHSLGLMSCPWVLGFLAKAQNLRAGIAVI